MSSRMSETQDRPGGGLINKIRFSLVWRLNTRLFFRLLGIFLTLDLLLALAASGALLLRAEQSIASAAETLQHHGLPMGEKKAGSGLRMLLLPRCKRKPKDFTFPSFCRRTCPVQQPRA